MINCQRLLYSHGCKILGLIIKHEYSKDAKKKKRVILQIEVGVKGITILVVLINLNNFETSVQYWQKLCSSPFVSGGRAHTSKIPNQKNAVEYASIHIEAKRKLFII